MPEHRADTDRGATALIDAQEQVNARLWDRDDLVEEYATRDLRPAEIMLLVRYREALSGRVLELGCGAGRLTGYLAEIAKAVHGIDISPSMLAYCRRTYPRVTVEQRDLRDLSSFDSGSFDVLVAPYNALDVLNDENRRRTLDAARRIVPPGGLVIMSSHNRASAPMIEDSLRLRHRGVRRGLSTLVRMPRWRRNRRRLLPLERAEPGYAILNDISHDFGALHYYISRDAQASQLAEHGFELLECLDGDGRPVEQGAEAPTSPELHYVARRST